MRLRYISVEQRNEWNAFVEREPSFGLLQSWEWGEFKEELGWKVFRVAVEDQGEIAAGAQMLIKRLPLGCANIAYIPRGPIGNWLDKNIGLSLFPELHRIARFHNAVFLKAEPPLANGPSLAQIVQQYGFRPGRYNIQPRATIILNLSQNLDDILKQMRQKNRQYIRSAIREEITVRAGRQDDLSAFCDLMEETCKREHIRPRNRQYYERIWRIFAEKKRTVLLMAFHRNRLLAVRTVFCFGKNAAEFHAGSVNNTRGLHPNYLLVWEAIRWAKEQGCSTYDFWGIPDELAERPPERNDTIVLDRTDGLWGVYRFKSGFCRDISYYAGAYDYVYKPVTYAFIMKTLTRIKSLDNMAPFMDLLRS